MVDHVQILVVVSHTACTHVGGPKKFFWGAPVVTAVFTVETVKIFAALSGDSINDRVIRRGVWQTHGNYHRSRNSMVDI